MHKLIGTLALIAGVGLLAAWAAQPKALPVKQPSSMTSTPTALAPSPALAAPISDWQERATKKLFGTHVSPGHSPVLPERFTGYHTGVDFETFPSEQDAIVPIIAACTGKILLARHVTGYGGAIVQACTVNKSAITVIYGHLNIARVTVTVGSTVKMGTVLGNLGKGYSTETDGERKHLHVGVHRGSALNIRGYVGSAAQLKDWIDPMTLLR